MFAFLTLLSPVATKAVAIGASAALVGGTAVVIAPPAEPATPETSLVVPAADEAPELPEVVELPERPTQAQNGRDVAEQARERADERQPDAAPESADEPSTTEDADEDDRPDDAGDQRSEVAVAVQGAIADGGDVAAAAREANGSAQRVEEARAKGADARPEPLGAPEQARADAGPGTGRDHADRRADDAEVAPDRPVEAPPANTGRPEGR